jgi:phage major tail protein, phi13 family
MASIGSRKPYIAKYNYDEVTGEITYTECVRFAKSISFELEMESSDDNNLYADDGIAESDTSFAGGNATIGIDNLTQEATKMMLGVREEEITVGDETVKELVYDDDMEVPDMGFGQIIPKQVRGKRYYRAVILRKIKFNIPNDAAETKGETIEWQTPELESVVMRDDGTPSQWKREATFEKEENAESYIKEQLGFVSP